MLKISPGYETIEQEFEASLRRAFVDRRANYIVLVDRRSEFLHASVAYGQDRGWLSQATVAGYDQSEEWRFRLTSEGKAHFGVSA